MDEIKNLKKWLKEKINDVQDVVVYNEFERGYRSGATNAYSNVIDRIEAIQDTIKRY